MIIVFQKQMKVNFTDSCVHCLPIQKSSFQEKKDILNQEYNVWTPEIRKEVETMCNLSESIAERAETKGFDKGYNKGTIKTLVDLVKDNLLSIAEASKRANMTEEEFKKYLS